MNMIRITQRDRKARAEILIDDEFYERMLFYVYYFQGAVANDEDIKETKMYKAWKDDAKTLVEILKATERM